MTQRKHTVDDEIVKLRDVEGVTSIVVTHQIRDAVYVASPSRSAYRWTVADYRGRSDTRAHADFMVLHEGRILFEGSSAELLASRDHYLNEFLFMTLPPW